MNTEDAIWEINEIVENYYNNSSTELEQLGKETIAAIKAIMEQVKE